MNLHYLWRTPILTSRPSIPKEDPPESEHASLLAELSVRDPSGRGRPVSWRLILPVSIHLVFSPCSPPLVERPPANSSMQQSALPGGALGYPVACPFDSGRSE